MVLVVAKRKPGRKPKPRVFDGAKLRELRGEMSQKALAERVGVHETDIGNYERGEFDPSLHTLVQLAKVLGVTESDLLKK
jgi:transcriptional regulator with XRE-family HTH domain